MKRFLCIFMTLLSISVCWAGNNKKAQIWEQPAVEENTKIDGKFEALLHIYRVELNDTETKVYMHIENRPGYWVNFVKETYLNVDGKHYVVKSCDGLKLDEYFYPVNGKADVVFHFDPLPKGTKKFDFIEGDGEQNFKIFGIQDKNTRASVLFPSLWRNETSGDWEIGFYDDFAIYDCHYWQYKQKIKKGDKYSFILTDGKRDLAVNVDKPKDGKRMISFGDKKLHANEYKEAVYSLITTIALPDYPQKDNATDFKDNHYQKEDSVTLVGWLKDMPESIKQKGNEYNVITANPFNSYDEQISSAPIDSLGRFTVKVPLYNASEALHDWKHIYLSTLLEPGETYFLLYDFKEGHKLFMGKNCRLQNEILAHPMAIVGEYPDPAQMEKISAEEYMAMQSTSYENAKKQLSELLLQAPNLSERYRLYSTGYYKSALAEALRQGTLDLRNSILPHQYTELLVRLWKENKYPYTFYQDFRWLNLKVVQNKVFKMYAIKDGNRYLSLAELMYPRILKSHQLAGDIKITDAEIDKVEAWTQAYHDYLTKFVQEKDPIKRGNIDYNYEKSKIKKEAESILARKDIAQAIKEEYSDMLSLYQMVDAADSLHCSPELREIIMTQQLVQIMKNNGLPLNDKALKYLDTHVSLQSARQYVLAMHHKLLAIQNASFTNKDCLKTTNSDIKSMTDGEKILRKLMEPYKGKIILIDVWGTWCGPCKEALSHSKEEYKRLAPYDMEYLYLANHSSEDSWKNIIKLYGVTGDNVAHYNLPEKQQNAIETYLKVRAYPSYFLFDKNGNLVDLEIDARNIDALENIIKGLSK